MDAGREVEEKCNPTRPFGAEKESCHSDKHRNDLVKLCHSALLGALAEVGLVVLDHELLVPRVVPGFLGCGLLLDLLGGGCIVLLVLVFDHLFYF